MMSIKTSLALFASSIVGFWLPAFKMDFLPSGDWFCLHWEAPWLKKEFRTPPARSRLAYIVATYLARRPKPRGNVSVRQLGVICPGSVVSQHCSRLGQAGKEYLIYAEE